MKITFRLSSTAIGSSSCSLRLYRQTIQGLREKALPARVVYGIAVHKYLDKMYKTANLVESIIAAKKAFSLPKIDNNKSIHLSDEGHMLTTCMNIWAGFIQEDSTFEVLSVDGKPLTEQTFSYKIYEDDFIEVYLEGTLDKIGKFKGGIYAIGDWKTTSSWDNEGYFSQFELSRQLRFYRLATILESRIAPESAIGKIGASKCGVFIDGIFLKPDRNALEVKRSPIYQLSDEVINKFEEILYRFCGELSNRVKNGTILYPEGTFNGACEGKWGRCPYWNLCKTTPAVSEILEKRDFDIVPWQPQDYNNLKDEL
jgi:hypothetical protein